MIRKILDQRLSSIQVNSIQWTDIMWEHSTVYANKYLIKICIFSHLIAIA